MATFCMTDRLSPSAASMPQTGSATSARKSALTADVALDRALGGLVAMPGGPPRAIAIVQRGQPLAVHTFGVSEIGTSRKPRRNDYMRVASIAKAFSGAAALERRCCQVTE